MEERGEAARRLLSGKEPYVKILRTSRNQNPCHVASCILGCQCIALGK